MDGGGAGRKGMREAMGVTRTSLQQCYLNRISPGKAFAWELKSEMMGGARFVMD